MVLYRGIKNRLNNFYGLAYGCRWSEPTDGEFLAAIRGGAIEGGVAPDGAEVVLAVPKQGESTEDSILRVSASHPGKEIKAVDARGAEVRTNPEGESFKRISQTGEEKGKTSGSQSETAMELLLASIDGRLKATADGDNFRMASPSYTIERLPTLYSLSNLGALLCDMPVHFDLEEIENHRGVRYHVKYRWSDGSLIKEYNETLLNETLCIPLYLDNTLEPVMSSMHEYLYHVELDPSFREALMNPLDNTKMARNLRAIFGGRDDTPTFKMMQGYAGYVDSGDNHLAYLTNMCRYYYSALLSSACGQKYNRIDRLKNRNCVYVQDAQGWLEASLSPGVETVSCRDNDADYLHFLCTCATKGLSLYPSWTANRTHINMYDALDLQWNSDIVVVSEYRYDPTQINPRWVGNVILIKGYIERYVHEIGAKQQLNEAFNIACLMPNLIMKNGSITIPEPKHTADVFSYLIRKEGQASNMSLSVDYAPARQILSAHLTINMIDEAMNSFVQGMAYERDRRDITPDMIMSIYGKINIAYSQKKIALLTLVNKISGLDLTFLHQIGGYNYFMGRMVDLIEHPKTETLFKLLIQAQVYGSYSHTLRKGLVMVSENVNDPGLRISNELAMVLRHLGYEDNRSDITGRWNDLPYSTSDKLSLKLHHTKRLYYRAVKDRSCKLYLEMIDFGNRPEIDLDYKGQSVSECIQMLKDQLKQNIPYMTAMKQQPRTVEDKKLDVLGRDTSNAKEAKTTKIQEDIKVEVPSHFKGKINKDLYNLMIKAEKEVADRSYEQERILSKRKAANSKYILNSKDDEKCSRYFDKKKWVSVANRGGGDCGPLSIIHHLEKKNHVLGRATVEELRKYVCAEQHIPYIAKEWWDDLDFTMMGWLLNITIIMEVISQGRHVTSLCLYMQEESEPMVFRNTDCVHFEALETEMLLNEEDKRIFIEGKTDKAEQDKKESSPKSGSLGRTILKKLSPQAGKHKAESSDKKEKEKEAIDKGEKLKWNEIKDLYSEYTPQELLWVKDFVRYANKLREVNGIDIDYSVLSYIKEEKTMWDCKEYDRLEIQALDRPVIVEGYYKSNVNPSVPLRMILFKKLNNTKSTWDQVEYRYMSGHINKEIAIMRHMLLWPFINLPRNLRDSREGIWQKQGCGCFACNVIRKKWGCPLSKIHKDECMMGRKERIPSDRPGKSLTQLLPVTIKVNISKKDRKEINYYFPFSHQVGGRKSNIDIGTLVSIIFKKKDICDNMWKMIRKVLINRQGDSNNLITSLILVLIGNTMSVNGHIAWNNMGILGCCTEHWIERFKAIHDEIRSSHTYDGYSLDPKDHSQLMYTHLLYGRLGLEVDWEAEKAQRTRQRKKMKSFKDGQWTNEQWVIDLKKAIDEIVERLEKPKKQLMSLEEYRNSRWSWMASGAATGKGKFLDRRTAATITGEEIEIGDLSNNKRSISEKMDFNEILQMLEKEPIQRAFSHTKANELAKVRSIFGVEMEHYILHNYLCMYVEPAIRDKRIAIKEEASRGFKELLERLERSEKNRELNSFDFSDFNDQHDSDVMKYLHIALMRKLKTWYGSNENWDVMKKVGVRLARSFMNMKCLDPVSKSYYKRTGGMYSGNRATTLINTMLNQAYTQVVRNISSRIYGEDPVIDSYHTGDDIVMHMRSRSSNLCFNEVAAKIGLEANPTKQLNDKGVQEYLRLTYYSDGQVLGSLCRSIGAFVNGNWESDVEVEPLARAQACWDQCSVLLRRGLDKSLTQELFDNLLEYYSRCKIRGKDSLPLSNKVVLTEVTKGGLGLGLLGEGTIYTGTEIKTKIEQGDRRDINCESIKDKLKASNGYIKHLNSVVLPKWAKVRKNTETRAINSMAKTTIGLELPRRMQANKEVRTKIKEMNNQVRDNRPKIKELRMGDVMRVVRRSDDSKKFVGQMQYIKKMEVIYPLLSYDPGYGERDLRNRVEREEAGKVLALDKKLDRTDGGRVPPQLQSIISTQCRIYNEDPTIYYNSILQDGRLNKIKY